MIDRGGREMESGGGDVRSAVAPFVGLCRKFQGARRFMSRRTFHRKIALMLLMAARPLLCARGEGAAPEEKVKAAFVFNFMAFTEWPAGTFKSRGIRADRRGFVGKTPMERVFRESAVGRAVNGRAVLVKQIRVTGDGAGCQVIVIPGAQGKELLKKLADAASRRC